LFRKKSALLFRAFHARQICIRNGATREKKLSLSFSLSLSLSLFLSLSFSGIYERGRSKRSPGSLDKRVRKLLNYFLTPCVIHRAISTQYARDCPTRDASLAGKNVSGLIPFYGMGDLPWHGAACTPVMKNVSPAQKILSKF